MSLHITNLDSVILHRDADSSTLGPHVGSLPLLYFINIMIGCLVIAICFPATISFLKLIRRTKFSRQANPSTAAGPLFTRRHSRQSYALSTAIRSEVSVKIQYSQMTQPHYVPDENMAGPDLPIPVARPQQEGPDQITAEEIEECERLIKEKMKVEALITNLQRVDEAQRAAGAFVRDSPTQQALAKRWQLDNAIREILERLQSRQETLSEDERRVFDEISLLLTNGVNGYGKVG